MADSPSEARNLLPHNCLMLRNVEWRMVVFMSLALSDRGMRGFFPRNHANLNEYRVVSPNEPIPPRRGRHSQKLC